MRKMWRKAFSIWVALVLSGTAIWSFSSCERREKQPSTGRAKQSSTGNKPKPFASGKGQSAELENVKQLCETWKYKDAYELSRNIVQQDPNNPEGWFWLGFSAHRILRTREAKTAYLKATELNPEDVRVYLNLGILYGQYGWYLRAVEYYRHALTKNPNLWESYTGLGDVYRENAAYQKAIENYVKAVQLNPKDRLSQSYIGLCREAQKELNKQGVVSAHTLKRLADISITPRWEGLPPPPGVTPFQVRFGRGDYNLSENDRRQLEEVAQLLKEWRGRKFVVEGYTCPCGSVEANKELSRRRAQTVRAYLREQAHVSAENLFVKGYGEENPIVECRYENLSAKECERDEEHSMNRRVLLRVWLGKQPPTDIEPF